MKKIKDIRIRNFKFVQDEVSIKLDGLNALIHGDNGTGKSTLYWALHAFFESSLKEDDQVKKYFDPSDHNNNLINLNKVKDCKEGNDCSSIEIDFLDETGKIDTHFISLNKITVNKHPEVKEVLVSSDFINYRLISGLYHCPPSEEIDMFPYFEANIFNLIKFREGEEGTFLERWFYLKSGLNKRTKGKHTRYPGKNEENYIKFQKEITDFNNELSTFVNKFIQSANDLLESRFNKTFRIGISIAPTTYNHDGGHYTVPPKMVLNISIPQEKEPCKRPHIFLNEEKMTAIALSIRFALIIQRLNTQNLKLLIVDDLLISIDMSNRMCVLDIILDIFSEFQIIVLTHDLGFFNLMKNKVDKTDWKLMKLDNHQYGLRITNVKEKIEYAQEAFSNGDYELCGLYLRKELEEIVREFMSESDTIELKWKSLNKKLNAVKDVIINKYTNDIAKLMKNVSSTSECDLLFTDIQSHPSLTNVEKAEYKKKQQSLKNIIKKMSEKGGDSLEAIERAQEALDRVANPAAHSLKTPLFSSEVYDAIKVVIELRDVLSNPALDHIKERFRRVQKKQSSTNSTQNNNTIQVANDSLNTSIQAAIKHEKSIQVVLDIMIGMLHSLTAEMLELAYDYICSKKEELIDVEWDSYLIELIRDRDWSNKEKNVIGLFIEDLLNADINLNKRTIRKLEKNICMPYRDQDRSWYFPIITDGNQDNEAPTVIDDGDVPF